MSEETLKKNVARFNKKVNAFKENNDIRYSERTGESVSNRSLLANAFEGITQNNRNTLLRPEPVIRTAKVVSKALDDIFKDWK